MKCNNVKWLALAAGVTALAGSPAQPFLDNARELFKAGHFKEASEAYRQATQKDAGLIAAWRELGESLHAMGDDAGALKIWDDLLRIEPRDYHTLNVTGDVNLAKGEFETAKALFTRSLAIQGDQPTIRVRLGETHEGLEAWDKASRIYDDLLAKDPANTSVLLRRARVDEKQGRFQKGIDRLEAGLKRYPAAKDELQPRLIHLYSTLGDQYYKEADYPKALLAYGAGLRLDPKSPHNLLASGWTLRRSGDTEGAIRFWDQGMLVPEAATANLVRALAEAHLELNHLTLARQLFERARVMVPLEPSPCLQLAEIGFKQQDTPLVNASILTLLNIPNLDLEWADRASELFLQFEKADQGVTYFKGLDQAIPGRNRALARIYASQSGTAYRAEQLDEAVRLGRLALEADPKNRVALRDLGWAYAKQTDWKKCAETWQAYVAAYPDLPETHDLLAQAYLNLHDYKNAIAQERLALVRDPAMKMGRLRLLRAFFMEGMLSDAKAMAAQLYSEFPDDLTVLYRYAEISTRLNDHAQARVLWQKLKHLDPDKLRPAQNWIRETYAVEDYDSAVAEARKLAEQPVPPESVLAFLWIDASVIGDREMAVSWLQRLTQNYPKKPEYWLQLKMGLDKLDKLEEALQAAENGVASNPDSIELKACAGEALLGSRQFPKALKTFRRLAAENPGNAASFRGLINSLMSTGRNREALDLLAIPKDESFIDEFDLRMLKGDALEGMGKIKDARASFESIANPKQGTHYVPIILYHGVIPQVRSQAITPTQLENQLTAVAKEGYTTIFVSELEEMIDGRKPWPAKPILITFDDARTDSFLQTQPILERLNMKATMMVPTGEPEANADLFHASWKTICRMEATHHWEMQGHGYEAHDPIIIDAEGHPGKFLVEREWLFKLNRAETDEEFIIRVNEDYKRCKEMLYEHLPQGHVNAFAFPYSEVGQTGTGSVAQASLINSVAWRKHYRFGMVQNGSGFNAIKDGFSGTRLLWRFEPSRDWSGDQLAQHLATSDPANVGQMKLLMIGLWEGYREQTRKDLDAMTRKTPAMKAGVELALAQIALTEDRPREAAAHLATFKALAPPDDRNLVQHDMPDRLDWSNRPRVNVGGHWLSGTDHRSNTKGFTTFAYPFEAPVDLELELARYTFAEQGLQELNARSLEGRMKWAPIPSFAMTGKVSVREVQGDPTAVLINDKTAVLGGLDLKYNYNIQEFEVGAERLDMDTNSGLRAGVKQAPITLAYAVRTGSWSAKLIDTMSTLTDQNRIDSQDLQAAYQPTSMADWQFGLGLDHADSRAYSFEYYTPVKYWAGGPQVAFSHMFYDGSSLNFKVMAGRSHDQTNGSRWQSNGKTEWTKLWSHHFRTTFDLAVGTTTGYASRQGGLILEWHF